MRSRNDFANLSRNACNMYPYTLVPLQHLWVTIKPNSFPTTPLSAFSCSLSVQSAEPDQCSTTWSLPESTVANSTQNKLKVASERKVENKTLFQLHLTAFVPLGPLKNKLFNGKGLAVFSDLFSVRTLAFIKDLESNGQASSVVTK